MTDTWDPAAASVSLGSGPAPPDAPAYDPGGPPSILSTAHRELPGAKGEGGPGIPWNTNPPDEYGRPVPDAPPTASPAIGRIIDAANAGFQDTKPLQTEYLRSLLNRGPLGRQIYNPTLDAIGTALGVLNATGSAAKQGVYEVGNAVGGPRLGRDAATLADIANVLLPQTAGPRAGMTPDYSPAPRPPRYGQEVTMPPRLPWQSDLGRIRDLIRNDDQWYNPDAPGYYAPGADPRQAPPAFVGPGVPRPPTPAGPTIAGVPDRPLVSALGPDPNAPPPGPTIAQPNAPSYSPTGTATNSAGARNIASQYYRVIDKNADAQLSPQFNNNWIDTVQSADKQTEAGRVFAGPSPLADLSARVEALRGKPLSLQAAQEVDQALGDLIDKEYGLKGISANGQKMADLQRQFRAQIDNAQPSDITGGTAGFDAMAPARKAWSQAMKMDDVERMKARSDMTSNPTTAYQTAVKNYVTNDAKTRGWTDDELSALKDSANRGVVGGTLHLLGSRLLPIATAAIAGSTGGLLGGIGGWTVGQTAGAGIRSLGDALGTRRFGNAMRALDKGVPPPPAQ